MKGFKGKPLEVTFNHHGTVTVARATITWENVPSEIRPTFEYMFMQGDQINICSRTICKDTDTFDTAKGERIARKKLIKKFMSMVNQAAEQDIKYYNMKINEVMRIQSFAAQCHDSIVKYLGEQ